MREPHVSKSRKTRLEMTVSSLRQRFGPQAVFKADWRRDAIPTLFPHIPTGFPALDELLGIGGLPKGRISELVGQPTSGKTTLALKFLSQAQGQSHQVAFIDQARYFDPDYAHRCGIDLSRLVIGTPCDPTETLAMVEALVQHGGLASLVVDTLDFLWADARAAGQLNASLNRLTVWLPRSGVSLLFLHDPLAPQTPALATLKHYASVRLEIVRERWHRSQGDIRGYDARIKVLKNRFGPDGSETKIGIHFNGTVRSDEL